MLQLLFSEECDASTVALATSFIKERMEGARDMIGDVDSEGKRLPRDLWPPQPEAITIDEAQVNRLNELEEVEKLLYVLREIAETSEDAESVRLAYSALSGTEIGRNYLKENPIPL